MMNWFERLAGFQEISAQQVRQNIAIEGDQMTSHVNGRVMRPGLLEIPSLGELRQKVRSLEPSIGQLSLDEIIADVQDLHTDPVHQGAVFQVASQFNLLEMISPEISPEQGISRYESDITQGPACAMAAGAGTIYRNYFAEVEGHIGQSATHQIDCLADLGVALGNTNNRLWEMKNGYVIAYGMGLREISDRLNQSSLAERDALKQKLRIGIQWNTEVTLTESAHLVTQVYCSALPVAYSLLPSHQWESFAKLILEAAYEATICVGLLNQTQTGSRKVFLTLLGGGAFGNADDWISQSILAALSPYRHMDLDLLIVSYGRSKSMVQDLIHQFRESKS